VKPSKLSASNAVLAVDASTPETIDLPTNLRIRKVAKDESTTAITILNVSDIVLKNLIVKKFS